MDRRFFLKNLPAAGILLFEIQNAFSSMLPRLFIPVNEALNLSELTVQTAGKSPVRIPIWWKNKLAYVSAFKLAGSLNYHTYYNDNKRKIVLYLPQNQVVVTADNAFVIVDDSTYQMPAAALWQNGEIYLPLKYFLPLLHRRTTLYLDYDENKQIVRVTERNLNIGSVSITEKENGTVIRIRTTRTYKEGEITADMRYGWLHVDFYGGKADAELIQQTPPAGLVLKIKTFQFAELSSLAFYLSPKPDSTEILKRPERDEVLVVLRTKQDLSDEEVAELHEEDLDMHEPSEEIKKQLEEERRKWMMDVVVIDPGHGGKDPGTVGIGKTYEKDIVLSIAKKLGRIIKKEMPDVKVVYTRSTDKFISLHGRTKYANEKNGKVFISIHANSARSKRASGFETYLLGPDKGERASDVALKENSVIKFEDTDAQKRYKGINNILATMAQNAFSRQSEYLASQVQVGIHKQMQSLKLKNRGVKQAGFYVLVGASMPNILVETGFVSNPYDVKILKTSAYQYKIAQGIFEGFSKFKRDYENAI